MIQRIQTVYLLLAAVVSSICLFLPLGHFEPAAMGVGYRLFNFYELDANHHISIRVLPLFVILVMQVVLSIYTIFKYTNRKRQMTLCTLSVVLLVAWYGVLVLFGYLLGHEGHTFHPQWTVSLPIVSCLFVLLARRSIVSDEKLVRAADRIR